MTEPIASRSADRASAPQYEPDPEPDRASQTQPATPVRMPPPLPDTDAAQVANAVKAALAAGPLVKHAVVTIRVQAPAVELTLMTPIQRELDAFRERATPTFHTPEGDVRVAIPFRMTVAPAVARSRAPEDQVFAERERKVTANASQLVASAGRAGLSKRDVGDLVSGRSTPETVRRVTQALINAGALPPGTAADLGARIRVLMSDHGIGIDCAGYVQQAFIASRGARPTGFREPRNEDLSGLERRGFTRLDVADAAPGDILVLASLQPKEVGHTVVVREVRTARPDEAATLSRDAPGWEPPTPSAVKRLEVDSSWGSAGSALAGGVQRRVWWHDEGRNLWVSHSEGTWKVGSSPYDDHRIEGVYRPSKER